MPDSEIELGDDEDILRVFLRRPDETWGFAKLRKADFARYMEKHSGMSMLRLKFLKDRDEALNWFKSDKLKGLAICKVSDLKALGLRFMAGHADDKHISVRCPPCNLEVNYPTLCKVADGGNCLINLKAEDSMCQKIFKVFRLDTPVKQP